MGILTTKCYYADFILVQTVPLELIIYTVTVPHSFYLIKYALNQQGRTEINFDAYLPLNQYQYSKPTNR
jgi:hypothetical protein